MSESAKVEKMWAKWDSNLAMLFYSPDLRNEQGEFPFDFVLEIDSEGNDNFDARCLVWADTCCHGNFIRFDNPELQERYLKIKGEVK
jgi:hypothetical protein